MPASRSMQQRPDLARILRAVPRPAQGVRAGLHAACRNADCPARAAATRPPHVFIRHAKLYPLNMKDFKERALLHGRFAIYSLVR